MSNNASVFLARIIIIFILFCSFDVFAQRRVIDHIETNIGQTENAATVLFNVPVQYISHLINDRNNEIEVRVKPVITPGSESDFFGDDEVITWRGTAQLPLERVIFRGELQGASALTLSFGSSISDFVIDQSGGQFSLTLKLKKEKTVTNIDLDQPKEGGSRELLATTSVGTGKEQPIASGNYIINLLSQTTPVDFQKIPPVPMTETQRLFTTLATVKGQKWYRLRIGFFKTQAEAREALKELRHFFKDPWIDLVTPKEKKSFVFGKPGKGSVRLPQTQPQTEQEKVIGQHMESVRDTMTAGDYPKAIRMLTAILETKNNPFEKEAIELLGLARERNGQFAHANAEYARYLEKYPEGPDAERIRQRQAGLLTAAVKPKEKLRRVERPIEQETTPWDVYGSIYQIFREDRIRSDFVDEEDSVSRREIDTNLDITGRKKESGYDVKMQFSGGYTADLLNKGSGSEATLSSAYLDVDHEASGLSARVGRQRFRSSGILNRFDGSVLGYRINDKTKVNAYAGVPVERSSDTFIREDKFFVGMNAEFNSIMDLFDLTLFGIEQHVDGLVDRRAVGAEARYFETNKSVFGLLDYDIFYNKLNTFLVQSNWTVQDDLRLYANYDYRTSPILTTSSALVGQTETAIADIKPLYSNDQIYDLAQDRTATSQVFSFGGTYNLSTDLQLSGDLTLSRISSTPASGGVEATESTGNEFYYTAQVIKNNLLKNGDIGILSLRYSDSMSSDTISLTANSRYPVTNLWRIKPKLTASYRDSKSNSDTRTQLGAQLQTEYRYRNDLIFEAEIGGNWYEDKTSGVQDNFLDYFLGLGYRWTF